MVVVYFFCRDRGTVAVAPLALSLSPSFGGLPEMRHVAAGEGAVTGFISAGDKPE